MAAEAPVEQVETVSVEEVIGEQAAEKAAAEAAEEEHENGNSD